jgi:hypothetical protein
MSVKRRDLLATAAIAPFVPQWSTLAMAQSVQEAGLRKLDVESEEQGRTRLASKVTPSASP